MPIDETDNANRLEDPVKPIYIPGSEGNLKKNRQVAAILIIGGKLKI